MPLTSIDAHRKRRRNLGPISQYYGLILVSHVCSNLCHDDDVWAFCVVELYVVNPNALRRVIRLPCDHVYTHPAAVGQKRASTLRRTSRGRNRAPIHFLGARPVRQDSHDESRPLVTAGRCAQVICEESSEMAACREAEIAGDDANRPAAQTKSFDRHCYLHVIDDVMW
jgi:hypothetical protein